MSDQDISALRQQLHHLRTHGVLREACSLLLDQVAACRLGVTTVDALKKSRAWATAKAATRSAPKAQASWRRSSRLLKLARFRRDRHQVC